MAKKIVGYVKLQVPAGKANPAPPIGPALGQRGLNIMEFCKAFNAQTQSMEPGLPIPVVITAFADKSLLTPALHAQYLGPFPTPASRVAPWILARELSGSNDWYASLWEARDVLADIPALVMWGTKDPLFPLTHLERWRATLPHARVERLERALDALQALLAALADRHQLGLDLAAALDRQADGIGVGASGHDRGSLDACASRKRTVGRPGGRPAASGIRLIADQLSAGSDGEN